VFLGASLASETTAAATGQVGVVRRDPMAMLPFCGYNMADYWAHWLSFAGKSRKLPKVFHVNWFRQDAQGKFIWPGFGENLRVLRWVIERCQDTSGNGKGAVPSPIGWLPAPGAIDTRGLDIGKETMRELTSIDPAAWLHEMEEIESFFAKFGGRIPKALPEQAARIKAELRGA
jgi:phosphoenolpyruvate carboxykinase (GTP)